MISELLMKKFQNAKSISIYSLITIQHVPHAHNKEQENKAKNVQMNHLKMCAHIKEKLSHRMQCANEGRNEKKERRWRKL